MNLRNTSTVSRIALMTSDELKVFRKKLGLSQEELANELKVAPNTVSRWELGRMKIPEFLDLALKTIERKDLTELSLIFNSNDSEKQAKKVALFFLEKLKIDLARWELTQIQDGHKMELQLKGSFDENLIETIISLMRMSEINVSSWSIEK